MGARLVNPTSIYGWGLHPGGWITETNTRPQGRTLHLAARTVSVYL